MRKHQLSDEQKMALQIVKLVNSDVTMNLDLVGKYVGQVKPSTGYNRLQIIVEAAQEEREPSDYTL